MKKALPIILGAMVVALGIAYLHKPSGSEQKIQEIHDKFEKERAGLKLKFDSATAVAVQARAERDSSNARTDRKIDSVNVLRKKDAITYQRKIARLETRNLKQLEYEADSLYTASMLKH